MVAFGGRGCRFGSKTRCMYARYHVTNVVCGIGIFGCQFGIGGKEFCMAVDR